jgi:hypothetical protein
MDKVPPPKKKKIMSVNFSCVLFSLLDFLTFEAGIDRLSQNVGKDLPLYTAKYPRGVLISRDDLVRQALVWLHIIQFSVIWFGVVQFSTSYTNLRQPHLFKYQI